MYRKNVASQFLCFTLVNASTGVILTGATVTAKRSIDGGAQASVTGTVSEKSSSGQYELAMSQADTNGNNIGFLFTASSAIPVSIAIVTTAADPTDAVRLGLTALPNAVAGANGGLPLGDASGRTDVGKWLGQAVTNDANNVPNVSAKYWAGTAIVATSIPVGIAAGAAGGLFIAGSNAATTASSFTITGLFSINGANMVAQTGNSFTLIGAAGAGLTAIGDARMAFLDIAVSSRLASASYTAPDNTSTTAIKAKTDQLTFSQTGQVDANIKRVADTTVTGAGTSGSPWGP